MCGICGVVEKEPSKEILLKMVNAVRHRGPDAQNVKVYNKSECGFGHARLSIIDLSEKANQPMDYRHLSIVFNGEIYNFREIKKELETLGHIFELDSDTEMILHAYEQWGEECVNKFIGMFAFAVLDRNNSSITIFRDRTGIKPLFYFVKDDIFIFGSELKSFYEHPRFEKLIDSHSVALYFKYRHVPAPYAIFKNTYKLQPGHYLRYSIVNHNYCIKKYWDVLDHYNKPIVYIPYEDAKIEIEQILKSAFNYRMVADVPVGVFLSGGYDSCGVAAILQSEMTNKLKTFTIGFSAGKNEAPVAKRIADYLGTDHTEYICTPQEAKDIIPEIPFYYDEPYDDSSAIPTILVSRLAREQVTVALSADGGDEVFAGYSNCKRMEDLKRVINATSYFHTKAVSNVSKLFLHGLNQFSDIREKSEAFIRLFTAEPWYKYSIAAEGSGNMMESLFKKLMKVDYPPFMFLLDERKFNDPVSLVLAMDYLNYLPNDILTKVDRATMSVSLEGREPFLDHRIIEFVAPLPTSYKLYNGQSKRIYKDIVHKYIPQELMDRPKTGFGIPLEQWMKTDLRYLLEEYINPQMSSEFLNVPYVLKLKELFLSNKLKHEERLIWRILEFLMWKDRNSVN